MKQIYIYSRGEFEQLPKEFKQDKAIIRIHNINDKEFYPEKEDGAIVLFFNDVVPRKGMLNNILRLTGLTQPIHELNKKQAREILSYIYQNRNKDFVIHCEYGRSRSVAVGLFIEDIFGYLINNKKVKDRKFANQHVVNMLHKLDLMKK